MKDLDVSNLDLKSLDGLLSRAENKKNIEELVAPYIVRWKWILLSLIVALILAFIYLRYTDKVYRVDSTIILKNQNETRFRTGNAIFSSIDIAGTVSNLDNEIEVMRSKSLVERSVGLLNLNNSYIVKGRVKSMDLYKNSPLLVSMEKGDLDSLNRAIKFTAVINKDNSLSITREVNGEEKITKINQLPALFPTPYGKITMSLRPGVKPTYDRPIEVIIRPSKSVVPMFRGNLSIAPTSPRTSVLNMRLTTTEPKKGVDFLNTLVSVYNQDAIADKTREALNTKDFIDERIAIIDRELGAAERTVEQFKRSQGLTDLQSDVQLSQQKSSQYEQKLVDVSTQLNLVDHLDGYVSNPENKNKLVPSNVGVNDPTLTATISEYNKQILERDRLLRTNTESNPAVQRVDGQIDALREAIGTSIASAKQGLSIARRDAQNQVNYFRGQTGMAPTQERQFTELAREQQIKNSLFLMLLQKREENALALSISANSAKVLDNATISGPIAPKSMQVYMVAFLLGLLFPVLIIFLRDFMHFKIESRADVERLTKLPILGEIPVSSTGNIAVHENENKETDEAFRMLRTNLLFVLGKDKKVVIVSSTEPKEGKTFISINSAISLAMLGKKVLMMGLDLRLPRMSEYLQVDTSRGMSEYLSGYITDIDEIIQPSGIVPNLSVITSGTVPPNASELIAKDTFDKAIAELKDKFDYIVIDSAPVSTVTDTVVAARAVDATMFVSRANYSHKNNLRFANELSEKAMLPNMALVINDISNYHFGYGFGYGRKYGYGYSYGYGKNKKSDKRGKIDNQK